MKSLFSWMLLGTGLRAMGVHREQRESRVQGMRQAPFMMDEPLCITCRRRGACKGSAIFCPGALGFGADALDDDAPFPLFYGTSRVLMLLFKGSIVRNLIKEGDERT